MNSQSKIRLIIFLLAPIALLIGIQLHKAYQEYNTILNPEIIEQNDTGYHYQVFTSNSTNSHLIITDLFGFNDLRIKDVINLENLFLKTHRNIFLEKEKSSAQLPITQESLIYAISDENNIMITDNFCTQNWKNLSKKDLYRNTNISPGQSCFTSKKSLFIDRFIKKHSINHVTILYKSKSYLNLLKNFTEYLKENNISINLKNLKSP